jgi:hypothetical protein
LQLGRFDGFREEVTTMSMPPISVFAVAAAVGAIFAGLLWYLLGRPFRIASTSQELLELFEEDSAGHPKS